MIFDPAAETMPADERARLQEQRLQSLVDRLLAVGGVQAGRLRSAGITSGAEVSLADLAKLPFTRKQDLWDHYPFGMLAVPLGDVVAVHGSSGTGGRPTLVAYTRADLGLWSRMCARALAAAGATGASMIHNAYGYGLFTGGLGIHQGAVTLGAAVIPVSGGMTDRQLTLLADLRPDILACTPSHAIRLGEALAASGRSPADLSLRAGLFGAEPWSEPMRARIEELLGLRALDIYGLSEIIGPGVAAECAEAADGLHVNEDHFIPEVIDPRTGGAMPDGEPGELVFSTPTREALRHGRCACGRTLVKMTKVTGRTDDMLVIRGVNVYPAEVEQVVLADTRLAPHYLLVVDTRSAVKELIVAVEYITAEAANPPSAAAAGGDLAAALRDRLGVRAQVRVLPAGSVPRPGAGKAIRVVTWAGGEPPVPGL